MKHRFLKKIYKALPLKKQVFSFVKFFWTPPFSIFQHLLFQGVFRVKVDEQHSFKMNHNELRIENDIFWTGIQGAWEKVSVGLWIKLCRRADVIMDVGANTGIYALIAKSLRPSATVFAFEPVSRVYKKLEGNARLNNYAIHCIEKALSNFDGKATIYDTEERHTYSVTVNKNMVKSDARVLTTKIETITMQTIIGEHNLSKIDLLKIDVETHEVEVLEGFADYLKSFRPTMLIEILNDEVGAGVEKQIQGMGYLYYNINDKKGTIVKVDRLGKNDFYNFLLCDKETATYLGLAT